MSSTLREMRPNDGNLIGQLAEMVFRDVLTPEYSQDLLRLTLCAFALRLSAGNLEPNISYIPIAAGSVRRVGRPPDVQSGSQRSALWHVGRAVHGRFALAAHARRRRLPLQDEGVYVRFFGGEDGMGDESGECQGDEGSVHVPLREERAQGLIQAREEGSHGCRPIPGS